MAGNVLRDVQLIFAAHPTATQVVFYACVLGGLWIAESMCAGQSVAQKLKHSAFNVTFMALGLPLQIAMMSCVLALATWCTARHIGLLYVLPYHSHALVKYGVMFLVLDFLDYAYHYSAHRFPWLWRLHLVHHSDRAVDVSTTVREHPVETLVRTAVLCVWVALCGASIPLLVLRQTFETIANIGQHSHLRLPKRVARGLQYVFVTPEMHHAHHHAWLPGTDCNYGDVLSIWDRIFRTKLYIPQHEIQFGVDTHLDRHSDLIGLLGLDGLASARMTETAASN